MASDVPILGADSTLSCAPHVVLAAAESISHGDTDHISGDGDTIHGSFA